MTSLDSIFGDADFVHVDRADHDLLAAAESTIHGWLQENEEAILVLDGFLFALNACMFFSDSIGLYATLYDEIAPHLYEGDVGYFTMRLAIDLHHTVMEAYPALQKDRTAAYACFYHSIYTYYQEAELLMLPEAPTPDNGFGFDGKSLFDDEGLAPEEDFAFDETEEDIIMSNTLEDVLCTDEYAEDAWADHFAVPAIRSGFSQAVTDVIWVLRHLAMALHGEGIVTETNFSTHEMMKEAIAKAIATCAAVRKVAVSTVHSHCTREIGLTDFHAFDDFTELVWDFFNGGNRLWLEIAYNTNADTTRLGEAFIEILNYAFADAAV